MKSNKEDRNDFKSRRSHHSKWISDYDLNKEAPPLFQPTFALQIMRMLSEIGMGLLALHLARSYQKYIIRFFQELSVTTQHCCEECTELLIEKGL